MAMIKLTGINKIYRTNEIETLALENVNLDVAKGEFVSIMGPSGCGKSTLLNIMGLLDAPSSGKIEINGTSVESMKDKELAAFRNKTLGFVFQSFHLINSLNVLDNVELPLLYRKVSAKERRRLAEEVLKKVGLSHRMRHMPTQLSGGQCQRVAIARVLATDPEILLCDEATSALDPQTTKSILSLLKEINEKRGITIVVITHEMAVVQEICSHVAVLDHGNLMETGTVEDLFRKPKTDAAKRLVLSGFAHIGEMKGDRKVRVTFDGHTAFEPIIGNIILEYKTPINILYADTKTINGNAEGEMILQLPQNEEIADKIVTYFKEKNLGVEEVDDYAR